MLHANRSGFFYVFDRTDGTLLLGEAVHQDADLGERHRPGRRPIKLPNQEPSPGRTKVSPRRTGDQLVFAVVQPRHGPYYVQTNEKCSIYTKKDRTGRAARPTSEARRTADDPRPQRILRAIDIQTGAIKWEVPQRGLPTRGAGRSRPRPGSSSWARMAAG